MDDAPTANADSGYSTTLNTTLNVMFQDNSSYAQGVVDYAESFGPPVREGVTVTGLHQAVKGGFDAAKELIAGVPIP